MIKVKRDVSNRMGFRGSYLEVESQSLVQRVSAPGGNTEVIVNLGKSIGTYNDDCRQREALK